MLGQYIVLDWNRLCLSINQSIKFIISVAHCRLVLCCTRPNGQIFMRNDRNDRHMGLEVVSAGFIVSVSGINAGIDWKYSTVLQWVGWMMVGSWLSHVWSTSFSQQARSLCVKYMFAMQSDCDKKCDFSVTVDRKSNFRTKKDNYLPATHIFSAKCVMRRRIALSRWARWLKQVVREAASICPAPYKLTFDLLTLKVVSKSRVTWSTSANFSLPKPLCSRLRPDFRDRQTDVRRQTRIIA